jgi:type II restriction enzyme
MYNDWFIALAPEAFRNTRIKATKAVAGTLKATENLTNIKTTVLRANPAVLPTLRMSTCPPLAVDRLVGLAGVGKNLVGCMEEGKLPPLMAERELEIQLQKISHTIEKLADPDIFVWLGREKSPSLKELYRAATIVADRLCSSVANPIIRNAQEQRQLALIAAWLKARGYRQLPTGEGTRFNAMRPGTFAFHLNVPAKQEEGEKIINITIDAVVMPKNTSSGDLPLLIEAKSAGDFTNVNKRRKEEATKIKQLRYTHENRMVFVLFLCGYFDSGYLGYEAAEGIDWLWEHRIDDLAEFGI